MEARLTVLSMPVLGGWLHVVVASPSLHPVQSDSSVTAPATRCTRDVLSHSLPPRDTPSDGLARDPVRRATTCVAFVSRRKCTCCFRGVDRACGVAGPAADDVRGSTTRRKLKTADFAGYTRTRISRCSMFGSEVRVYYVHRGHTEFMEHEKKRERETERRREK